MGNALITDLNELNMAASYLRRGMVGPATFSLFVRRLPPSRGFLVAAGLEECLEDLESFAFDPEDLAWLGAADFHADVVDMFAAMHFSGDVFAVPEGRVVFADEPLLEVTAPIAEAQLVETYLLNQVTYQTALATKAPAAGWRPGISSSSTSPCGGPMARRPARPSPGTTAATSFGSPARPANSSTAPVCPTCGSL